MEREIRLIAFISLHGSEIKIFRIKTQEGVFDIAGAHVTREELLETPTEIIKVMSKRLESFLTDYLKSLVHTGRVVTITTYTGKVELEAFAETSSGDFMVNPYFVIVNKPYTNKLLICENINNIRIREYGRRELDIKIIEEKSPKAVLQFPGKALIIYDRANINVKYFGKIK